MKRTYFIALIAGILGLMPASGYCFGGGAGGGIGGPGIADVGGYGRQSCGGRLGACPQPDRQDPPCMDGTYSNMSYVTGHQGKSDITTVVRLICQDGQWVAAE